MLTVDIASSHTYLFNTFLLLFITKHNFLHIRQLLEECSDSYICYTVCSICSTMNEASDAEIRKRFIPN